MKTRLTMLVVLLILLPSWTSAQQRQRKVKSEAEIAAAEIAEAKAAAKVRRLQTEIAERASQFDVQVNDADPDDFNSAEFNTVDGRYRVQTKSGVLEGKASVSVMGCYVSLTDTGKLLATVNLCRGLISVYLYSTKEKMAFQLDSEDEDEGDDEHDDGGPPPVRL